ncbi:glycosyltransferase family 39 protein [Methanobrevibacter sp. AbM4]|uniref:ArnT family glycosyltransferase n=1 Tax=Methanobrevibacter sp. AbM4 TaxID=224719 RepID=UPI00033483F1|nr:glycosyltransferase family 39 protein [Methanobrevibacter sp. AbM4]AGN16218.1 hypothetical protein Abm4_0305 [Methanobrevibacter sp. AbM4]
MEFTEYKKDIISIILLLTISATILYTLLNIDMKMGVYYIHDVYSYLNNALAFAGLGGSSKNHGLSPLIPFLTSLFFRLGFVSDKTILIVSGVFYIFTALGMYGLLRIRFNELLSFTGSIVLLTFPINIAWVSKGMLDIPGLAMSIWAIYLMALGLYKNPKYYYLAFPVLILGFFTRYTVILTLPAMIMLIFFTGNPLDYIYNHLGKLLKGILSGIISLAIVLGLYRIYNIPFFFISQSSSISATSNPTASQAVSTSTAAATVNNVLYYLDNIPLYLGTRKWIPYSFKPGKYLFNKLVWIGNNPSILSYIFMAIILIGIILYLYQLLNRYNRGKILKKRDKYFYAKVILFIIPLIFYFISFTKVSLYTSILLITVSVLALFRLIRKADLKYMAIDFMFIYWGLVNITFYSYHIIKTDRYAITFTPVLAYMIVLGLYLIYMKLKDLEISEKTLNTIKVLIPMLLIIGSLGYTGYCIGENSPHTFDNRMPQDIMEASDNQRAVTDWLINYDKDYKNKEIWADDWSGIAFNLRMDVNNTASYKNQSNFTTVLLKNNVDYYIAEGKNENISSEHYKIIKEEGNIVLYKRI